MAHILIRPARPDEWETYRDLRLRALADSPDAFGETLAEARGYDDAKWQSFVAPRIDAIRYLAIRDDVPVAMCAVVSEPLVANVYAMWVAPEARGRRIGEVLLAEAIVAARLRGVAEVRLRVSDTQPGARRLYLRYGFVSTGDRQPLRPGAAVMADELAKSLPPLVMGIVNVTPNSFSDGYPDRQAAIAHGHALIHEGADILDVGGEATNPRATPVTADEELRRVIPVIEALAPHAAVSVDTTKAVVAKGAVAAGATIINDVSGGLFDPAIFDVIGDATYIAGHLRGQSLAEVFSAEAPVDWTTVRDELAARIPPGRRVWVDPGLGFGKGADPATNADLLRHAGDISAALGKPTVVGPSRKRFLRRLLGVHEADTTVLDAASVLASLTAVRAGARVVRIHNVALLRMHLTAYNKE